MQADLSKWAREDDIRGRIVRVTAMFVLLISECGDSALAESGVASGFNQTGVGLGMLASCA